MVAQQLAPAAPDHTDLSVTPGGLRGRMRAALAAGLSAFVLLAGVFYVFAPADASVRLSVTEVAGAQPFDQDIAPEYSLASAELAKKHRFKETIYGSVETKGVPVSKVVLRIVGSERRTRGQAATVRIKHDGTYRSTVRLRPGKYRFTLSLRAGKKDKSVSKQVRLKDKRAYDVSVKVREGGVVSFLPVTSY
jgi:hypothetical protein